MTTKEIDNLKNEIYRAEYYGANGVAEEYRNRLNEIERTCETCATYGLEDDTPCLSCGNPKDNWTPKEPMP